MTPDSKQQEPHRQPPNPNDLFLITREELDRCLDRMSASGYGVSANYVDAMVKTRPHTPAPVPICDRCKLDQEPFCIGCERLKEHDALVAQQAKKEVLDELILMIDTAQEPDGSKGELIHYTGLHCMIDSLRQSKGGEQQ
jgi:predicted Fe-S protein YdhL (DUF1289 family)